MRPLPEFSYERATVARDVDAFLREHPEDGALLAGGTDLLVQMRSGRARPRHVLDVSGLAETSEIAELADGTLRFGCTVRLAALVRHPGVRRRCRALAQAAATVGSAQIQNMATLVGNVCNASPAADTVPALLAHAATVEIRGHRGTRSLRAEEFFLGPGAVALAPDEWVRCIEVPPGAAIVGSSYVKLGRTRGVDIAVVGAAVARSGSGVRVGLASVGPTPLRARQTEAALAGGAPPDAAQVDWEAVQDAVDADISPMDDVRASADYRRAMAFECVRRAHRLADRAGSAESPDRAERADQPDRGHP